MGCGRPGARGKGLSGRGCGRRLHLPPGAKAARTWRRSPRHQLRGGAPQPLLTRAEAMGGAVGAGLQPAGGAGEGRGWGRKGDRGAPGTVCSERRRLPVTTTTAAQSNPALQAWPVEPRDVAGAARSRAAAGWQAGRSGVRCDHPRKPKFTNARALLCLKLGSREQLPRWK